MEYHLMKIFVDSNNSCQIPSGFNSFNDTSLFLYPLKTSENLLFLDVFRGYRKKPLSWNGLMRRKIRVGQLFIRTCVFQWVRNVSFSENFGYVLKGWPVRCPRFLRDKEMSQNAMEHHFVDFANTIGNIGYNGRKMQRCKQRNSN